MKNMDKLAVGIYKASMVKQANPILKLLERMAPVKKGLGNFGKGLMSGATSTIQGLAEMPGKGIPAGFKTMGKNMGSLAQASGNSKALRVGQHAGVGAVAGAGTAAAGGIKGMYDKNKMNQGKQQGIAEMLAQMQAQQQPEKGYLGNLLDAIMNKRQGV